MEPLRRNSNIARAQYLVDSGQKSRGFRRFESALGFLGFNCILHFWRKNAIQTLNRAMDDTMIVQVDYVAERTRKPWTVETTDFPGTRSGLWDACEFARQLMRGQIACCCDPSIHLYDSGEWIDWLPMWELPNIRMPADVEAWAFAHDIAFDKETVAAGVERETMG